MSGRGIKLIGRRRVRLGRAYAPVGRPIHGRLGRPFHGRGRLGRPFHGRGRLGRPFPGRGRGLSWMCLARRGVELEYLFAQQMFFQVSKEKRREIPAF